MDLSRGRGRKGGKGGTDSIPENSVDPANVHGAGGRAQFRPVAILNEPALQPQLGQALLVIREEEKKKKKKRKIIFPAPKYQKRESAQTSMATSCKQAISAISSLLMGSLISLTYTAEMWEAD